MSEKLLALNMIVGAGEAELLDRCLQSVKAKETFDEVIIVQTAEDDEVKKVIRKHGGTLDLFYKWESDRYPYGNFAGARNKALENTTCKYFMWLDADDVVEPAFVETFSQLKKYLNNDIDIFSVPYNLYFDKEGKATTTFERERIVRVRPDIFWQYPVHEQLTVDTSTCKMANIKNSFSVNHKPKKDHTVSAGRNLKILEHELTISSDAHLRYYLAREYWNSGQYEKSASLFDKYLDEFNGTEDSMAVAAMKIAEFNLYDYENSIDEQKFKMDTLDIAENFCRISFSFSNVYAEPWVYLGDIYSQKQDYQKAIKFYKEAINTKFKGTGIQDVKFYTYIPAFRLCQLFAQLGHYEDSLVFSKIALRYCPNNEEKIHAIRKGLLDALQKEYK